MTKSFGLDYEHRPRSSPRASPLRSFDADCQRSRPDNGADSHVHTSAALPIGMARTTRLRTVRKRFVIKNDNQYKVIARSRTTGDYLLAGRFFEHRLSRGKLTVPIGC